MRTRLSTVVAGSLAATAILGATAVPAMAHVSVTPGSAEQGSFTEIAFKVPNEREASTTKVQVTLPADQPLPFVSVKPHPGWSHTITKVTLDTPVTVEGFSVSDVVRTVTWTADSPSAALKAGEYDTFALSVGPMPEADALSFTAVQTYSNGEVVNWDQPFAEGAEEPEHPAPTVALTAADTTASHHGGATGDAVEATGSAGEVSEPNSPSAALWISLAALAAALTSLGVSARRRSRPSPTDEHPESLAASALDGPPRAI